VEYMCSIFMHHPEHRVSSRRSSDSPSFGYPGRGENCVGPWPLSRARATVIGTLVETTSHSVTRRKVAHYAYYALVLRIVILYHAH